MTVTSGRRDVQPGPQLERHRVPGQGPDAGRRGDAAGPDRWAHPGAPGRCVRRAGPEARRTPRDAAIGRGQPRASRIGIAHRRARAARRRCARCSCRAARGREGHRRGVSPRGLARRRTGARLRLGARRGGGARRRGDARGGVGARPAAHVRRRRRARRWAARPASVALTFSETPDLAPDLDQACSTRRHGPRRRADRVVARPAATRCASRSASCRWRVHGLVADGVRRGRPRLRRLVRVRRRCRAAERPARTGHGRCRAGGLAARDRRALAPVPRARGAVRRRVRGARRRSAAGARPAGDGRDRLDPVRRWARSGSSAVQWAETGAPLETLPSTSVGAAALARVVALALVGLALAALATVRGFAGTRGWAARRRRRLPRARRRTSPRATRQPGRAGSPRSPCSRVHGIGGGRLARRARRAARAAPHDARPASGCRPRGASRAGRASRSWPSRLTGVVRAVAEIGTVDALLDHRLRAGRDREVRVPARARRPRRGQPVHQPPGRRARPRRACGAFGSAELVLAVARARPVGVPGEPHPAGLGRRARRPRHGRSSPSAATSGRASSCA